MFRWITVSIALWAAGDAHAAKLVRCDAVLLRAVGEVTVPGWGLDEAQARARARSAAWLLARADGWPARAAGTVADPGDLAARSRALRDRLDAAADWEVPGYAVRDGTCTTETLPPDRGEAWSVTWPGEDRAALRNDPSVAIEAGRRRACVGAWGHRMVKAAQRASEASSERYAAGFVAARAATDGLFACMTAQVPPLTLAGAPLPPGEEGGTVQCARPRFVDGAWTAAPAWGATFEGAREAALALDARLSLERAEAMAEGIGRIPDPAQRAKAIEAVALTRLGGLVVATDLAEQALLSCLAAPARSAKVAWTPTVRGGCGGWPTGSGPAVPAEPAGFDQERARRCDPAFRQAITGKMDLEDALACDLSCRADAVVSGWTGVPVWRPGEPRRGSADEANKALSQALHEHDFHLFGVVTGGLIFEPAYAASFKADPTAFWRSIDAARDAGTWEQMASWQQVGGVWVLGFGTGGGH